jgi:hypothetical protein
MAVTVDDLIDYLGGSWGESNEDLLQSVLDAETAAQSARCRVSDPSPADLDEALKRRVARNLEMRKIPLAVPQGDAEAGPVFVPGTDPEVRRLEAPYRRLVIG